MASQRAGTATAHLDADAALEPIRGVRITVIEGPDAGRVFRSDASRVVIGSDDTADLVLTDPTVSRLHAEVTMDPDAGVVALRDTGSHNGTRVDQIDIESARLGGSTLISFGDTHVRFELEHGLGDASLAPGERFGPMVGSSQVMRAIFNTLERAASLRANLLIEGEAGTGKRLAAAAIHEASPRAGAPLRVIDCAQPGGPDPDDLAAAVADCQAGTLVLRDLAALPLPLGARLERALEDGPADLRVIATTRRALQTGVEGSRIPPGLYGRIAELRLRLPPLRERLPDLPTLVRTFLDQLGGAETDAAARLLAPRSIELLRDYVWPDNVRELRAHVGRCLALDQVVAPTGGDLSELPRIDPAMPIRDARAAWVRYFERRYLTDLLESTGQNVSAAARVAGVDRVHMHRLLKAHGLR